MAIHGRHALVFTAGKHYYELKSSRNISIMKFLLFYEGWKKCWPMFYGEK